MTSMTHAVAYVRTEAGKAEIGAQSIKLPRPARNLLLLIDASCTGQQWIAKVNGSTAADLDMLLDAKLIAPKATIGSKSEHRGVPVEDAVRNWKYDALYTLLTREAKERFGLIKGYRLRSKVVLTWPICRPWRSTSSNKFARRTVKNPQRASASSLARRTEPH